jgi:CTP synthase
LQEHGLDQRIVDFLWGDYNLADTSDKPEYRLNTPLLTGWHDMLDRLRNPLHEITIAVVGRYAEHRDAYKSIYEALDHAGIKHRVKVNAVGILSDKIDLAILEKADGILVAGSTVDENTGTISHYVTAVRFARQQKVPFLGIDLGMPCALIEFLQTVGNPNPSERVLRTLASQGIQQTLLAKGSKAFSCYGRKNISERHRHRLVLYEGHRQRAQKAGLLIAGTSPDGEFVQTIELPDHPWFVAVQFRPEFKSQPTCPHPLFDGFIAAALKHNRD